MMRSFDSPTIDLAGKSVLVTGGTGSFGQALTKRLLNGNIPARLVIFSRGEHLQEEMAAKYKHGCLRFFIGDVRDPDRLELAMQGIDYVIHAAALKIIPTAEYNPTECIATNIRGAENVIRAAIRARVDRMIALSTDKAVNPINLYGASKLAAEKVMMAANNLSGADGPRFSVARYGNVVGSRGSVVPLFRAAALKGEIQITHPNMTRFLMTLDQAVSFVLSSLAQMKGGEIFVPKLPSAQLLDIAKAVAPDVRRKIIGIRPGEKRHECMYTEEDEVRDLGDRFVIGPGGMRDLRYDSNSNDEVLSFEELKAICDASDSDNHTSANGLYAASWQGYVAAERGNGTASGLVPLSADQSPFDDYMRDPNF